MSELSSKARSIVRLDVLSDNASVVDAICTDCNKRFRSMRAVTMHLKITAASHVVNFIDFGKYDKSTGFRSIKRLGRELDKASNTRFASRIQ
jgi:hypothetical protein